MKKYILLTIFTLLGMGASFAQNNGISGIWADYPVGAGETTQLIVDYSADPFAISGDGEVIIAIYFPTGEQYTNDYVTEPTGTAAAYFDWIPNAASKAWIGISNQDIPSALNGGGGTLILDVLGVINNSEATTLLEVTLDGDINPADDSAEPSLLVPVELSSFMIKSSECGFVDIRWTTESEINNEYFIVERRIDNDVFETAGKVIGAGNSTIHLDYQFKDELKLKGKHNIYYRLKQVDRDGKSAYSDIIVTRYNCKEPMDFTIFPNPALDNVNLEFNSGVDVNNIAMEIYDNTGKVVMYSKAVKLDENNNNLLDISSLSEGIYRLKITDGNEVINKSLIKLK